MRMRSVIRKMPNKMKSGWYRVRSGQLFYKTCSSHSVYILIGEDKKQAAAKKRLAKAEAQNDKPAKKAKK